MLPPDRANDPARQPKIVAKETTVSPAMRRALSAVHGIDDAEEQTRYVAMQKGIHTNRSSGIGLGD